MLPQRSLQTEHEEDFSAKGWQIDFSAVSDSLPYELSISWFSGAPSFELKDTLIVYS